MCFFDTELEIVSNVLNCYRFLHIYVFVIQCSQ